MTMFSAEFNRRFDVMSQLNSFSSFSTSTGGGSDLVINNNTKNNISIVGPILMADDEESCPKDQNNTVPRDDDDDDDDDDGDQEWLQLSIGGQTVKKEDPKIADGPNSSNLVELQLMPSSGINNKNSNSQILGRMPESGAPIATYSPYLLQQHQQINCNPTNFAPRPQEINWGLIRPIPISIAAAPSSSSSSGQAVYAGGGGVDNMGLDFRVIQPPRRPHSGIWFMLQSSLHQEKEPFLPQISKNYLRIKDGRMVIRLVIKYLANKLRLENESEIELRCKGQRLQPCLTLQHVRDNIWSNSRDFVTLLPNSSTTQHIMVLHYARTASN